MILKSFDYLHHFIHQVLTGQKPTIKKLYLIGGRKSGKTLCCVDLICRLILLEKKVKVMAFRNLNKDIEGTLWTDIKNWFKMYGIHPDYKISKFLISYGNSNIQIYGLRAQKTDQIKLTGLSSLSNYDYVFRLWDESHEFVKTDIQDVNEAVRGCQNVVDFFTCNPWLKTHWLIEYCDKKVRFNKEQLETKGEQFQIISDELFHYTNWRVNNLLPATDISQIKETMQLNPSRGLVVDLGLPGVLSGTIFGDYLKNIRWDKVSNVSVAMAGLDYGFKKDATAAVFCVGSANFNHIEIVNEYYHTNKFHRYKSHQTIALEIVNFFNFYMTSYNLSGLVVWCDYSEASFIEMLNIETRSRQIENLTFQDCKKCPVVFHVWMLEQLLASNRITINNSCVNLWRELESAVWDEKKEKETPVDKDNHAWDALIYALLPYWNQITRV